MKVLLIEDDRMVQLVEKMMLDRLGCETTIAKDGRDALEKIKQHPDFDMIFSDIGLPDMSGVDVIKALREQFNSTGKKIPIIALTGYAQEEDHKAFMGAGANCVLTKPVMIENLKKVLKLKE